MRLLVAIFIICGASGAFASSTPTSLPQPKHLVKLETVVGTATDAYSTITVNFSESPSWLEPALSAHGSFLQIDLPDVFIPNPGQFVDGGSPIVKKIAIFQLTNTDGALRLFLADQTIASAEAMTASLSGTKLEIKVDHSSLKSAADEMAFTQSAEGTHDAGFVGPLHTAETESPQTSEPPFEAKLAESTTASLATGGLELRSRLTKIAAFLGVMVFLALCIWMTRPFLKKFTRRKDRGAAEEPLIMKTISSLQVSPKQKISLVQIGDEKILLGIGPDGVTFLTAMGNKSSVPEQALSAPQPPRHLMSEQVQVAPQTPFRMPAPQKSVAPARQIDTPASFAAMMASDTNPTVPLKLKPNPKTSVSTNIVENAVPKQRRGKRINIAVGDEVTRIEEQSAAREAAGGQASQKTIDDVTSLIREKLRSLKSI